MKIAHLVLAHKNPVQLERMVRALAHPDFDFFIHLDKKTNYDDFAPLSTLPNVHFIMKRVKVRWATYSLVQATINSMEEIMHIGKYDYINLLSAQDFPLMSANRIVEFLEDRKGCEFMRCIPFNKELPWWQEANHRVQQYNLQNWNIPGKYRIEKIINSLLPARKPPLNYTIAGNSQWFCITTSCAQYLIDFIASHPRFVRFFKFVWAADELIFSTIVFNSSFRKKVVDNLTYADWSGPKTGHPKVLGTEDLDALMHSGKLFARKFDMDNSPEIIDQLEAVIYTKVKISQ